MKTVFIRAIETPVDEKPEAILAAVQRAPSTARFDVDTATFALVPRAPFAYWASDALRKCFARLPPFESDNRAVRVGLQTSDDFRFVRLATESSALGHGTRWFAFAKGGAFSPFYADVYLVVDWHRSGLAIRNLFRDGSDRIASRPQNTDFYFRPGLTWPLRTQRGLSLRVMARSCVFGHKGPAAFLKGDNALTLLALAAITNSATFSALVEMQMAFGSYEVGVIQRTPVPDLSANDRNALAQLARKCWSLKRQLDTSTENSHAFVLPALLQVAGGSLEARAEARAMHTVSVQAELNRLQGEIDDACYGLYDIAPEERRRIEQGFGQVVAEEVATGDDEEQETELSEVDAALLVASLLSWSVGVAFGRFDMRLATGGRTAPPEPEPFDTLPVCSAGMLTGQDGLPVDAPPSGYPMAFPSDGILVDDPGHSRDLVQVVRAVFDTVFIDADVRWHEAAESLGIEDLHTWFARDFFEQHIKRYSRSRRRAPIYWQLSTSSGEYSVWIYIHRATADTLFRVLNDFVGPKLDHEKAKLDAFALAAGANPSAAQRREIDRQGSFVSELHTLKAEVARVAPLWRPNLDDGVILNFAPLWRLVPQSRSWQTECKKAWDELGSGDHDWAHLAMHLWPERVVPSCQDDRGLAIAHGLEPVFWHEDESGTWHARDVDQATVRKLIAERTSSPVKAALKDLLSAPTSAGRTSGKRGQATGSRTRSAASRPRGDA